MKAQDLMVGDWMIVDNEAMQVMPTLIDALFYDDPIKVEPIKITAEILKSNGFAQNGGYYLLNYNSKDYPNHSELKFLPRFFYFEGRRMENDLWVSKVYTEVKYVHELQHALRVIGLTDLADNLKIT